jgi:hypothetical protein
MGPIRCPETSVNNYHTTLRSTPEERTSHQHGGGSLKLKFKHTEWSFYLVIYPFVVFSNVHVTFLMSLKRSAPFRFKFCENATRILTYLTGKRAIVFEFLSAATSCLFSEACRPALGTAQHPRKRILDTIS